jgi:LEA14-like dessication related protein
MGALFLAGKVDETFRKIWDVASSFINIFKVYDPNPVPFQTRELTQKIREVIIDQERNILREMGFELFRFND